MGMLEEIKEDIKRDVKAQIIFLDRGVMNILKV